MSKAPKIEVDKAIQSIRALARRATSIASDEFDLRMRSRHEAADSSEFRTGEIGEAIESAFLQLLTLTEALQLTELFNTVLNTCREARRVGFSAIDSFEDQSGWSHWSGPIEQLADAVDATFGSSSTPSPAVSKQLIVVLRNLQTAITDKSCFKPPKNEGEVHKRSEMVLRCFHSDLIHKPPLAKSVKSFEPDSGIPSLSTLLEFKFLSKPEQAPIIADEILADTRGYQASDWANIVFVIYETRRFKTIHEWRSLLRQCGVPESIEVVVLHGEEPESEEEFPPGKKKTKKKRKA